MTTTISLEEKRMEKLYEAFYTPYYETLAKQQSTKPDIVIVKKDTCNIVEFSAKKR